MGEEGWYGEWAKDAVRKSLSEEVISDPRVNMKKEKSYDKILVKNIPVKGISQYNDPNASRNLPLRQSIRPVCLKCPE